jgi:high-affinity iron transporter
MRASAAIAAVLAATLLSACAGSGAAPADHPSGTVERVTLNGSNCAPGWRVAKAGRYDFDVRNSSTHPADVALVQAGSGIVVARLKSTAAHGSGRLNVRLLTGDAYLWRCAIRTGAVLSSQTIQVGAVATVKRGPAPVVAAELYQPLERYTTYAERLLRQLRPQLQRLHTAVLAGNLRAAEAAWRAAHVNWLLIGQDDDAYGSFGELGEQIDGSAAGLPRGTANPRFTGFHRVEVDLWRDHDTTRAAHDTAVLQSLVGRLTPQRVAADLPVTVIDLDSWILRCHEILEDALRDSLSQNDDYGSNSDLLSLTADVKATREMLRVLAPVIGSRAPRLVPTATAELRAIDRAVGAAGGAGAATTGRNLTSLPTRERQIVDASVDAALETLAPVSELMLVNEPGA